MVPFLNLIWLSSYPSENKTFTNNNIAELGITVGWDEICFYGHKVRNILTQYLLTAGELEVAGVPVQRVLHKLHTLAHHSDVTPADGEI